MRYWKKRLSVLLSATMVMTTAFSVPGYSASASLPTKNLLANVSVASGGNSAGGGLIGQDKPADVPEEHGETQNKSAATVASSGNATEETAVAELVGNGETSYWKTLQDAIDASEDMADSVAVLRTDITESIIIDGQAALDLGGYTLTNEPNKHTIMVADSCDLEISGSGTVDNVSHGKAAIYNEGWTCLHGGTYTRSEEKGTLNSNGGNSYYTILNHGYMEIDGDVTVENNGAYSSAIENGWYDGSQNADGADATLYITSGTYKGGLNTIKNDDYGHLMIDGGEFTSSAQAVILNWDETEITGGTFTLDDIDESAESVILNGYLDNGDADEGWLIINGGTFNAPEEKPVIKTMDIGEGSGSYIEICPIDEVPAPTLNGNIQLLKLQDEIPGELYIADVTINGDLDNASAMEISVMNGSEVGMINHKGSGNIVISQSVVEGIEGSNKDQIYIYDSTVGGEDHVTQLHDAVALVGGLVYKDLQTAADAAFDFRRDTTILLCNDVEVADTVKLKTEKEFESGDIIDKTITLDLAGHTISSKAEKVYPLTIAGNVVITGDGKVDAAHRAISVAKEGNLTIENGTFKGNDAGIRVAGKLLVKNGMIQGGTYGIGIFNEGKVAKITVEDGTIKGTQYYALAGNGTYDGTEIVIVDGEFIAENGNVIFHPQEGDLTITGGTFTGASGLQYCGAGNVIIEGGDFTATFAGENVPFKPSEQGDGSADDGAALSFVSRGGGYQSNGSEINVTISGGTFTSVNHAPVSVYRFQKNGEWVTNDATNLPSYLGKLDITGGTFAGNPEKSVLEIDSAAKAAVNVTGGQFSGEPECVAEGYVVLKSGEGYKVVKLDEITLSISPETEVLACGGTMTLTAELSEEIEANFTWASDNENVATVDANGTVTAVGMGEAVITVKTNVGGKDLEADCRITVKEGMFTLDTEEMNLKVGATYQLQVTAPETLPEGAEIQWKSTDEAVVTVADGLLTAVGEGTATVTASLGDNYGTPEVTVTVTMDQVKLNKTVLAMKTGTTEMLVVTNPAGANAVWTSDNNRVATVSQEGVVTAVSEGKATITVAVENCKPATVQVTVAENILKLNTSKLSMVQGTTQKLSVTEPEGAAVTWKSGDESVASVSADGTVTAKKAGNTTITASLENYADAVVEVEVTRQDESEASDGTANIVVDLDAVEKPAKPEGAESIPEEVFDAKVEAAKNALGAVADNAAVKAENAINGLGSAVEAAGGLLDPNEKAQIALEQMLKDVVFTAEPVRDAEGNVIDVRIVPSKMTYSVEAVKISEDGAADLMDLSSNVMKRRYFSFRIPIPEAVTMKYANVEHEGDAVQQCTIEGSGNGKYITVRTWHLSDFILTFTNTPKRTVHYSGGGSSAPAVTAKWIQDSVGWWYQNADKTWPANKWMQLDWAGQKSWYRFNEQGYMVEGWFTDADGNRYFLSNVHDGTWGQLYTGWKQIDGKWYYFREVKDATEGALLVSGVTPDGYKTDANGVCAAYPGK